MKAKCINNSDLPFGEKLSLGKEYEVEEGENGHFTLTNDNGAKYGYLQSRFELIPEPPKQKAYRFDSLEEMKALVAKFGAEYFSFIPKDDDLEHVGNQGFLYQAGGEGWDWGWTSADIEEFRVDAVNYGDLEMVTFEEAMEGRDCILDNLLKELQQLTKKVTDYLEARK